MCPAGTSASRTPGPSASPREDGLNHIGFEVDDLKAFTEMLEDRGITFDVPYREIPSIELAIAYFTDPSGVRIELTGGFDG